MQKQTIIIGGVVLLIGGVSGYALQALTGNPFNDSDSHSMMDSLAMPDHHEDDGHVHADDAMNQMNHADHMMMDMTVSSEREFITGMIPHHQEAVDTAKEVIARGGTSPEIKELAENIVIAQEAEIAQMQEWYRNWYGEEYTDSGDYVPMMRDLSQLSAEALDRTFLEDMIMHHMGAIMMAQSVQPYIEREEIEQLTQAIIETQNEEMQQMRRILKESFPL